eukprot:3298002-Alexandrium_andersonii.AAC.1
MRGPPMTASSGSSGRLPLGWSASRRRRRRPSPRRTPCSSAVPSAPPGPSPRTPSAEGRSHEALLLRPASPF